MKLKFKHIFFCSLIGMSGLGVTSCDDFLDREPITSITPDAYFSTADHIANYVNNYYNSYLVNTQGVALYHQTAWHAGISINDDNTDNFVKDDASLSYFAGNWRVPSGQNLKDQYAKIRVWNYLIEEVEPRLAEISGSDEDKNHYLGEGYFFRALVYFNAMANFGDLPIITEVLPNEEEYLKEKSQRAPRNEVARFIMQDLDKAISLLQEVGFKDNQRINKQVALLFKSRVALYEGTFEKYHKGTGRVPGDDNWPGKDMSYNSGKTFNIDCEIDFFLSEAMAAAKQVADRISLTQNSHVMNPEYNQIYGWNPYFEMFSQPSLKDVPEVLLWKQYDKSLSISHDVPNRLQAGDRSGLTHSFITSFLMKNGLPIYATGSGYKGDTSIDLEKTDRDERLQLFVWGESDVKLSDPTSPAVQTANYVIKFGAPLLTNSELQNRDLTGYRQRKHYTYDYVQLKNDEILGTNACPVFRAAEAYLNYIEASYEKNHTLDADALKYWQALRERAGVSTDIQNTINNTIMEKEAENDWAAYSGGKLIDATLYNIRRERRCEFLSEGLRYMDLCRWRSMDQWLTKKYLVEGFHLWNTPMQAWYTDLLYDGSDASNVSSPNVSEYLRPYQKNSKQTCYNGFTWRMAHYLHPIMVKQFLITAPDNKTVENSPIYQNPYWPMTAGRALE